VDLQQRQPRSSSSSSILKLIAWLGTQVSNTHYTRALLMSLQICTIFEPQAHAQHHGPCHIAVCHLLLCHATHAAHCSAKPHATKTSTPRNTPTQATYHLPTCIASHDIMASGSTTHPPHL
jgi:hypothetical protein